MHTYEMDYLNSFFIYFCKPWLSPIFYDARQGQKLQYRLLFNASHRAIYRLIYRDLDCPHIRLYPKYRDTSHVPINSLNKNAALAAFLLLWVLLGELHPVNNHVKTQPNHINKVPVPSRTLKRKVILRREMAFDCSKQNNRQHNRTHCDVETMETSQHKEC